MPIKLQFWSHFSEVTVAKLAKADSSIIEKKTHCSPCCKGNPAQTPMFCSQRRRIWKNHLAFLQTAKNRHFQPYRECIPVWHLSRICEGVCLCVPTGWCPCACLARVSPGVWHCDIRAELPLLLSLRLGLQPPGSQGLNNERFVCEKEEGSSLSGTPSRLKMRRVFFNHSVPNPLPWQGHKSNLFIKVSLSEITLKSTHETICDLTLVMIWWISLWKWIFFLSPGALLLWQCNIVLLTAKMAKNYLLFNTLIMWNQEMYCLLLIPAFQSTLASTNGIFWA